MGAYGPPVDQLLRIGNNFDVYDNEEEGYSVLGIGPEHIPDLIRLADDDDLFESKGDGPELWAPFHAWIALGQLHAEQAIPTLMRIIESEERDNFGDWIIEILPEVFGQIGPAAIPDLTRLIDREDASDHARENAVGMLSGISKQHKGEQPGIVATFARLLERAEWHSSEFNAFIICDLMDLHAKEAAEVIERAFAGDFVDQSICGTWYDVWHELKLEGEPPPKPEGYGRRPLFPFIINRDDPDDFDLDDFGSDEPIDVPEPREPWQPAELKTHEERKDRNKARAKLEKKVKGKGKGGKKR